MIQLFLHLLGDYFLQNDWMAVNKSKYSLLGYLTCFIHCTLYAIPFGLYYHNWVLAFLIYITHFLVDKFSLAKYWTKLVNCHWKVEDNTIQEKLGFSASRPEYLVVWLHIIRDNAVHLMGNYFIIVYLIG